MSDRTILIVRADGEGQTIGYCEMHKSGLKVKFFDDANVTRAEFFKMFGCGARIDIASEMPDGDTDFDNYIITEATILTFRWEMV